MPGKAFCPKWSPASETGVLVTWRTRDAAGSGGYAGRAPLARATFQGEIGKEASRRVTQELLLGVSV